MNVLFICTSNKDRSPALLNYFQENYPLNKYRSAGINKYFTLKHGTHYLIKDDIEWAEIFIYAEEIHFQIAHTEFSGIKKKFDKGNTRHIILKLGDYKEGKIREDYLLRAEEKIKRYLLK